MSKEELMRRFEEVEGLMATLIVIGKINSTEYSVLDKEYEELKAKIERTV